MYIDGTHSFSKKGAVPSATKDGKKWRMSNVVTMVEGKGLPIAFSNTESGNYNDLYRMTDKVRVMHNGLVKQGFVLKNRHLLQIKVLIVKHLGTYCVVAVSKLSLK